MLTLVNTATSTTNKIIHSHMPLSYNDVRKLILQTLEERPEGTKVEVPNQQNYELALLDYVQQLETTMSTSMVGIADAETEPIEPPSARVAYLSQVGVKSTVTYKNFVDAQLNPLVVTTDESHVAFVTLFWNTNYWQLQAVMIPVIAGSSGTMDYNELENLPSINGVTIKGDLTAEMLELVSSEIFDQYKKATDQRLDVIEEALFGSKAALQVAAVPPSITAGVLTDVTISWSTKFDGEEVTPDSLTVKRGDTVLTTDVALKSVVDHISETAQYTVTAVIKGVAKSAEIAVEANAKMYYGATPKDTLAEADVLAFTAREIESTPAGDIEVPFGEVAYLWVCVPAPMTIKGVSSSGFGVPMKPAAEVTVEGNNYNCYRSVNQFAAGDFIGVIS